VTTVVRQSDAGMTDNSSYAPVGGPAVGCGRDRLGGRRAIDRNRDAVGAVYGDRMAVVGELETTTSGLLRRVGSKRASSESGLIQS